MGLNISLVRYPILDISIVESSALVFPDEEATLIESQELYGDICFHLDQFCTDNRLYNTLLIYDGKTSKEIVVSGKYIKHGFESVLLNEVERLFIETLKDLWPVNDLNVGGFIDSIGDLCALHKLIELKVSNSNFSGPNTILKVGF